MGRDPFPQFTFPQFIPRMFDGFSLHDHIPTSFRFCSKMYRTLFYVHIHASNFFSKTLEQYDLYDKYIWKKILQGSQHVLC